LVVDAEKIVVLVSEIVCCFIEQSAVLGQVSVSERIREIWAVTLSGRQVGSDDAEVA